MSLGRCVCASPGFPPSATDLDLNRVAERGDREGEKVKHDSSRTEDGEKNQPATCLNKARKQKSLWLPPWCNVWRHALWGWGSVMVTMVPGSRYVCSTHAQEDESNDREERILAVLGIIGTVLNLLVVIFVYIYTSVT